MKLWELHSSEKAGLDNGGGNMWFRSKADALKEMKQSFGWDGKGLIKDTVEDWLKGDSSYYYVDSGNVSCDLLTLRQINFNLDKDSIISLLNGTQN